MSDELNQVLLNGVIALVPILVGVLVRATALWLKQLEAKAQAEVGVAEWEKYRAWAKTVILAAEQIAGLETNRDKKAWVIRQLIYLSEKTGLKLDVRILDGIIEGVFNELKQDGKISAG